MIKKMARVGIAINSFGRIGRVTFRNLVKIKNCEIVDSLDFTENSNLANLPNYDNLPKIDLCNTHSANIKIANSYILSPSQTTNMKAAISMSANNVVFNLEYQQKSNGQSDFEIVIKAKDWEGDAERLFLFLQDNFLNKQFLTPQSKTLEKWKENLEAAKTSISHDDTSEAFRFLQKILDSWGEKNSKEDLVKEFILLQSRFAHAQKEKCVISVVDYNLEVQKVNSSLINYIHTLQRQIE
jgi:Glyceraldehyde 3-phosphate dehydrogenase, NAD binding domain/Effector-associated domain 11